MFALVRIPKHSLSTFVPDATENFALQRSDTSASQTGTDLRREHEAPVLLMIMDRV